MKSSQRYLALTNVSVWSLPVLTSDCHALRHVADCRFSARRSAPRSRSQRRAPCGLSSHSVLTSIGSFGGFALSVYSGFRVYLCDRKSAHRRNSRNDLAYSDCHYRLCLDLPILPAPIGN
eukprot:6193378-Pleurochrysis_carterae.AAC.1